jgi:hypothetical protein
MPVKRTSEQETTPEIQVGQIVQLDNWPIEWEVKATKVDGFPNRAKIHSNAGALGTWTQTVDTYRLTVLSGDELAKFRESIKEPLEDPR